MVGLQTFAVPVMSNVNPIFFRYDILGFIIRMQSTGDRTGRLDWIVKDR